MKDKLHYKITINAPVKKVWETMLADKTYRQWTAPFEPTSYFEGSWETGAKMRFLSKGGDGMFAEIVKNTPHKFVSIKHLGFIKNGAEDKTSEAAKQWVPGFENYTFVDKGESTDLKVDIEMDAAMEVYGMKEMFNDAWPKALAKLKEISEAD